VAPPIGGVIGGTKGDVHLNGCGDLPALRDVRSRHVVMALYTIGGHPGSPRAVAIGLLPEAVVAPEHKDIDRSRRRRCGCR
jgi:hypothetical protein